MKITLSGSAVGAFLALTCGGAMAQVTATTTQQGSGKTALTEQVQTYIEDMTATIEQIGNNNRVGDPGTQTPGIYQRPQHGSGGADATVRQRGDGNVASIRQERIAYGAIVLIEQVGNNNSAAVRQDLLTYGETTTLRQTGNDNVASFERLNTGDTPSFTATQTGSDNVLLFRQANGHFVTSRVDQTGSGNVVRVDLNGPESGMMVEQVGDMNTLVSTMLDVDSTRSAVRQIGTGNSVTSTQQSTQGSQSQIEQTGNNNLATLNQILSNATSLIGQTGNNNRAAVRQIGGEGFASSIIQTGSGNNAGVYQH